MSNSTPLRSAAKPEKPYDGFPLFPHLPVHNSLRNDSRASAFRKWFNGKWLRKFESGTVTNTIPTAFELGKPRG